METRTHNHTPTDTQTHVNNTAAAAAADRPKGERRRRRGGILTATSALGVSGSLVSGLWLVLVGVQRKDDITLSSAITMSVKA